MRRTLFLGVTVIFSCLILSGCFPGYLSRKPNWQSTEYSIEEIKEKALPYNSLDSVSEHDSTEKALNAYNVMLGYIENVVCAEYRIFDLYYVDMTESYVLKVVINDSIETASNDENLSNGDERIIMLCVNKNGSDLQSGIEPYLMARRLTKELNEEMSAEFPDYHMNTWYINLDYIVPHVRAENYSDISDYTYFYKENADYYNEINVFVPVGTDETDADEIKEQLEPVLNKYFITVVNIIAAKDNEAYDEILAQEKMTNNNYSYDKEQIEWHKSYKLSD